MTRKAVIYILLLQCMHWDLSEAGKEPMILNGGAQLQYSNVYDDVSARDGLSTDFVSRSNRIVNMVVDEGFHYTAKRPCHANDDADAPHSIPIYLEAGTTYRFDVGRLDPDLVMKTRLFAGGLTNTEIRSSPIQRALSSKGSAVEEGTIWWEDRYESFEVNDNPDGPGGDTVFIVTPDVSQTYTLYIYRDFTHLGALETGETFTPCYDKEGNFFVIVERQ